ncbi:LysM peptidoglycan-binding domain-containing protein [Brevibacillus nitrificans]|uniref:LysM peptidoglycan-binding domain-containing protein n=1 Tax=Brevibacillus nitrificans TaxID=651560 RepID=UPI00285B856F|nr:LysM peptidoglycan-binding domain-containing protein [Brevibacillus nitrificans]MDR7315012.1 stage VI sporulation protein D [Brevibacillus nitrificans]
MALQDGLLSFAIKETIFLSSDRAGIGELQELELVPDVEVLENESYISITGCLQLFGKYEPIRDTAAANGGGTETLVEAMTFAPFRPEGSEGPYYGWEEQISHRVPLNITIPLERIAEIGDIYAIVDSFDYSMESPHQLLIEAELKIVGIVLSDQTAESPAQQESARQEEAWEFAHVASDQPENVVEPASLEEIEQKLVELEQQMERQAEPIAYEEEDSTSLYNAPAVEVSTQDYYQPQSYGEVTESTEEQPTNYPQEAYTDTSIAWGADTPAIESAGYEESPVYEPHVTNTDQAENQWVDAPLQREEPEEATLAIHDHHDPDFTPVATEEATQVEELTEEAVPVMAEPEAAPVMAEPEAAPVMAEPEAAPVMAEPEASEEVELRVAISGKPSREETENVNITSIFSQASRAKQEALAQEAADSSSSSSRRGGSAANANPSTVEAMQNLTSFIRHKEERSSRLKMCIIQRDETLELISQRYSLPVSKIVEVNRLASEQLVAGQILYIPQ